MTTDEIRQLVVQYARRYGINSYVALAQIQRESGFNTHAVGSSGERGLGQFMPETWARFGSGSFDNAFDPNLNLDAWAKYMAYLLGLFGNDYNKALAGYNGGEGHLTSPAKFGPPSQAALNYASQIMSQASAGEDLPNIGQILVTPGGSETPDWVKWAALGLVGLLIWTALSD